jgi:2-C-methyl-D-erythritol 2,4-cyclodiphosphate synthase
MGEISQITGYRIGFGFDAHRLAKGRNLILGGEKIEHPTGLLGHSDADVLTHAVMSAILGAMAAGSLGDHFPDTDPQYKDIRSIDLLERVRIVMEESGYTVENIDSMAVCDKPRLGGYVDKIRMNLAEALRIPIDRVSVKATSTEGLGYTGTGEGIAAHAVALLKIVCEDEKAQKRSGKSGVKSDRSKKYDVPPLPKIKPGEYKSIIARVDGASDGNPGPSGIGIVFETPSKIEIGKLSEKAGENTSNQAEYLAAVRAVKIAKEWGVERITVITDSQLMERQVNGSYKVKNPGILNLYQELMILLMGFKGWQMQHVGRDENMEADKLSKIALKKRG